MYVIYYYDSIEFLDLIFYKYIFVWVFGGDFVTIEFRYIVFGLRYSVFDL